MRSSFQLLQLFLCVLMLTILGCGSGSSDIGTVEGVVTLDGNPVDRATIIFYPPTGRSSFGYTDENGHYSLVHSRKNNGALIGNHRVTISTEIEKDYLNGANTDARKETMPAKYLDPEKTDLTGTVNSGSNEIDFELKSSDF